jgi:hypothetical protein
VILQQRSVDRVLYSTVHQYMYPKSLSKKAYCTNLVNIRYYHPLRPRISLSTVPHPHPHLHPNLPASTPTSTISPTQQHPTAPHPPHLLTAGTHCFPHPAHPPTPNGNSHSSPTVRITQQQNAHRRWLNIGMRLGQFNVIPVCIKSGNDGALTCICITATHLGSPISGPLRHVRRALG